MPNDINSDFLFTALLLLSTQGVRCHLQACQEGQQAADVENQKVRDPAPLGGRWVRGRGSPRGRFALQPPKHFQSLFGGPVHRSILPSYVSDAVL